MIIKAAGLVSSIALLAAISGSAYAQTSNSNATSSSGAASQSSSGAVAVGRGGNASGNTATQNQGTSTTTNTGVTLNQSSTSPATTTANVNQRYSGGTSNSNYNQQGGFTSSDNTVRAAPTVYAPPVSGGSPCSLGYSAGASFLGWGAAAGGQVVDSECERRMHVAMLFNAGWKGASKELACNNKEVYFAFRGAGEPCNVRPQWEANVAPAPQPMVQQQPTVVTPVMAPPPVVAAPRVYPKCRPPTLVDNCTS